MNRPDNSQGITGIEDFIRANKNLFEDSFGDIAAEMILNKYVQAIFGLVVVIGIFLDSLQTFWWHNLAALPLITVIVVTQFLQHASFVKKKKHYILNVMLAAHITHYVISLYVFSQAGKLSTVPGSMFTLVIVTSFFISNSPSRAISIALPVSLWSIAFGTIYSISPSFAETNLMAFIQGCVFGSVVNYIFGLIKRYKFYFVEQEKRLRDSLFVIAHQRNSIKAILDSIKVGIFSISNGETQELGPDRSKALDDILHLSEISGPLTLSSILLSRSTLTSDQKEQVRFVLESSIDTDVISFEANSSILPTELTLTIQGRERFIELDWSVVTGSDRQTVAMVLVCCRDVTELRKIKEEVSRQSESMAKLIELVSIEQRRFTQFFGSTKKFIEENKALCLSEKRGDWERTLKMMFVNLHTIKGSARTLGLKHLAAKVHDAEDQITRMQKQQSMDLDILGKDLSEISQILDEYGTISREQLNRNAEASNRVSLDRVCASQLALRIVNSEQLDPKDALPLLSAVFSSALDLEREAAKHTPRLATDLGKAVPIFHSRGLDGVWLTPEAYEILNQAFVHLVRNSMDHGIETPAERHEKGKRAEGAFIITAEVSDVGFVIRFSDDGRGMGIARIRAKAIERGMIQADRSYSPSEIAELIFESGLSTTQSVTEISGRGVGMGAVRDLLQRVGGSLQIEIESGTDDYLPFKFKMQIPLEFVCVVPNPPAKRKNIGLI